MDNFVPTNTLASTAFDVLKMDAVDDPLINVNKLGTLDLEESYFATAVAFVNETNREVKDNFKRSSMDLNDEGVYIYKSPFNPCIALRIYKCFYSSNYFTVNQ